MKYVHVLSKNTLIATLSHDMHLKTTNNIINGLPIIDNPTKVISFMFRTLLVLKLLKYLTPGGGHLGFVQNGCHRGSPSWLPPEIGRLWSYLALVQN